MRKDHTEIVVVLDRSGSMMATANDTIGGFNKFLKEQKEAPGSCSFTLHQFDNVFETPIKADCICEVKPLTDKTYFPRGSTALLDAMGRAIQDLGAKLAALPEDQRAEKVVVVVITDGEENASREFNRDKVFAMIKEQREKYKWEFVFLAANQDAIKVGTGYGFGAGSTMTYAQNSVGTDNLYVSASSNVSKFRSGVKSAVTFEDEDIKKQQAAGVK